MATHIPTGLTVVADGRSQWQNRQTAFAELQRRLTGASRDSEAQADNQARVQQIEDDRTFNWCGWRDEVHNHRNGKKASMAKALKGKLDSVLS